MGGRREAARLVAAALVAIVVVLLGAGAALAGPARPTTDPTAPTPTAPYPGRPPQGEAPDGRTVGGEELDTRGLVVAEGTPRLPAGLIAPTWLVADAGTGAVLAARDPHGRFYPASTLKTLTLLTLLPVLDPTEVVVGTVEDENIEGTRVGIVAGGRYPVQLLYEALMLASGNDAANALARAAGGAGRTVAAMNETAEALGAFDTVAGTPSGLDVAGQSSSVYDLALIFRALLDDPRGAALLRVPTAQMPAVPGRSTGYQIQNKNPLLARYPGNLGAKNGFTSAARHGFVTAAERGGRRLVASVLGSEATPLRAADQAALLLDWGFSVPARTGGVGRLVRPAEAAALAGRPTIPRHDDANAGVDAGTPTAPEDVRADRTSTPSPVVPVVLVAGAVVLVGATLIGRRIAVRTVSPPGASTAVPAGGSRRSPAAHPRSADHPADRPADVPGTEPSGPAPTAPEPREPEPEPEPEPREPEPAPPHPRPDSEGIPPGSTPGSPSRRP
jgi:D-alanyl-D-alanine carboxypeptidase (penicillin-binding protein 5/6)